MAEVTGRLWAIRRGHVAGDPLPAGAARADEGASRSFGSNTFDVDAMKEKLPKPVFQSLQETIRRGNKLDPAIANEVAHAVKEWALAKGATHFCHWFQPQTGLTAEKHDAFLTFDDDGRPMERFSGAQLIQSEPDASSFPSGGMRTTFEARGYTAWDPSSPIFIIDGPERQDALHSVGLHQLSRRRARQQDAAAALDGVPLREGAARAARCSATTGDARGAHPRAPSRSTSSSTARSTRCAPTWSPPAARWSGPSRPRARSSRTTTSAASRTASWPSCRRSENELYKLGIPIKTRHNEVAPSQYETAPIFEEANVASDHNQIVMETHEPGGAAPQPGPAPAREAVRRDQRQRQALQLVAAWTPRGDNLLEPGRDARSENLQFLVFLAATLKGVHQRAGPAARGHRQLRATTIGWAPTRRRRRSSRSSWASSSPASSTPSRRARPAGAAALERISLGHPQAARGGPRQDRPQPHLALRLHREQVRVPRRVVRGRRSRCPSPS